MDDKKKTTKEGEKALSEALDRDHDGSIMDNLGGLMGKTKDNPNDTSNESENQQSREPLDRDHDGGILDNLGSF